MSVAEVLQTPALTADPDYSLGERIRRARLDAGLQQQELANLVGVSRPQVSKWERNLAVPDINEAVRIALVTGKPLGWLANMNPTLRWKSETSGQPELSEVQTVGQVELPFPVARELALVGPA